MNLKKTINTNKKIEIKGQSSIVKHEGVKTVVFIGVILDMAVIITGMFLENRLMVIIGVAVLLVALLIASVVFVVRLSRRRGKAAAADPPPAPEVDYAREKEKSERRRAPVRELLKNTLLIGGFLTSCVLFIVFCAIKEFVLACIVWGCGVALTLFAFVVMLIRERIQKSDLGRSKYERDRAREIAESSESAEPADNRVPERNEQLGTSDSLYERAPIEPSRFDTVSPRGRDLSGKYRLAEAAVRSADLIETRADTVECGGQTLSRRYGLYKIILQSGNETRTAISAVPRRRGEFVNALFSADGDTAVIITGNEIKLGGGRYKQACGKVKMCIVDIATMVEKRKRTGGEYGELWAVDPDYRYIVTAEADGRRVRIESEIYYTEGTGIDVLECRGNGVAVFVD